MASYLRGDLRVEPYAFIIGSPRSGTTILGEVLDAHPRIAQWYEPYFVWDRAFRLAPHDSRSAEDVTPSVREYIRQAFEHYRLARGVDIVVDKSPRNSLKLPFVHAIFPNARYIFLLRDGRDTVLSLHREWMRRKGILGKPEPKQRFVGIWNVVREWLSRQPLWAHRIQAILFEAGPPQDWIKGQFLHRKRWNGRIGWGPRFPGWEALLEKCSLLEFAAHQWVKCVEGFLGYMGEIPEAQRITLKYEEFVEAPGAELQRLLEFLGVPIPDGYFERIPKIRSGNFRKWARAFSQQELELIGPIITDCLIRLGYEDNPGWLLRAGSKPVMRAQVS